MMMAAAIAILSVVTALVAGVVGWRSVALALLVVVATTTVALSFAAEVGARRPKPVAVTLRASVLIALSVGAALGASAIWLVSLVTTWTGSSPGPWAGSIAGAAVAAIAVTIDPKSAVARLMPARFSSWAVRKKYSALFPVLDPDQRERGDAYRALNAPILGDEQGEIKGWGLDATRRRLVLIARGLEHTT